MDSRISRRGALGRLFGLGAGAAAATMLPVPVQAAPVAPTLPQWLIDRPDLGEKMERYARAHALVVERSTKPFKANFLDNCLEVCVRLAEIDAGLRDAVTEWDDDSVRDPQPPKPLVRIPDNRVVVVEFERLNRNQRRRLRRWIARQPSGPRYPRHVFTPGRRDETHDFLRIATPTGRWYSPVAVQFYTAPINYAGALAPILVSQLNLTWGSGICSHGAGAEWDHGGAVRAVMFETA